MNLNVVPPGIRFDDYVFAEAQHISQWALAQCAGLFVILVRNASWAPKPFEPLYFGEFGNNSQAPLLEVFRMANWAAAPDLFVATLLVPFSTTVQRQALRDVLIRAYNPVWQRRGSERPIDLERKLEELERRNEEQTNQFRLLLATLNKFFEPLPVPPRRPIGFATPPLEATPNRAY